MPELAPVNWETNSAAWALIVGEWTTDCSTRLAISSNFRFVIAMSELTGVMEEVFATRPREEMFKRTGIQFLPFNTLFQFFAHARRASQRKLVRSC